jgi:gliding motility-associated-like protein
MILGMLVIVLCHSTSYAQRGCPDNIGFERGSFTGWKCWGGFIASTGVVGGFTGPAVITDRHTILQNSYPQQRDPYGNFPVNCPNGSGYSVKLGNDLTGAEADRVSFTFTVPIDKDEYSIIYNYAIVFQNPGHLQEEQPRFTSKVYDVTAGEYLGCGSFEFIASSGLPGFELANVGLGVYFKPWSPVTVKLMGCAGKTITIEFTVNDCSRGGHFGYAYLDVNENCASPITGNVYCNGATSVSLTAPFGFKEYKWYTAGFDTLLGTSNVLYFNPIPPVGTTFALEIVPYPDLGCLDTLYTTIELSPEAFVFQLQDTLRGCLGFPANLTMPSLSQSSSQGLSFSYFLDSTALQYLPTPSYVLDTGTYYVKAVNNVGCNETEPIKVLFSDLTLIARDPPIACSPNPVDITAPSLVAGSDPGLAYSYPLPDPDEIYQPGLYFIKGQGDLCSKIAGVTVRVVSSSDMVTQPMIRCDHADLTSYDVTAGSTPVFTFSQWKNAAATVPLPDPQRVTMNGTYFIKGTTVEGCSFIKPVDVTIRPLPVFSVTEPPAVTAPFTVNLANALAGAPAFQFSFWSDAAATKELSKPSAIAKTGRYYIKASDTSGCEYIQPVNVVVNVPYHPVIQYPNVFSPNKDGVHDGFKIDILGNITLKTFRVYDRWGQLVFETIDPFEYWYGERNGKQAPAGTYYWIMELVNNNNQDFYRKSGSITMLR